MECNRTCDFQHCSTCNHPHANDLVCPLVTEISIADSINRNTKPVKIGGKPLIINFNEKSKELLVIAAFFATIKLRQSGTLKPSIYELSQQNGINRTEVTRILAKSNVKRLIDYYMTERIYR